MNWVGVEVQRTDARKWELFEYRTAIHRQDENWLNLSQLNTPVNFPLPMP
jgi:hypothetical protein